MAAEGDLAKLSDVKSWVGLKDTNLDHDDDLSRLVSACSAAMQRVMERTIASADYRHAADGPGAAFMLVKNYPITRVSSVSVDGRTIDPARVSFDETAIYLSGGERFARGRQNVALRYTAGFDTVPFDLEQVCIETVGLRWRERDRIGLTSKGLQGETTSFSLADFSPMSRSVLDSYKRRVPL